MSGDIVMKNILIIDDKKNIRTMVKKCLDLEGYTVDTADNGYDGIKLYSENKYDLVMLDIRMPELSGTEVLKIMKSINSNIPVIIITAFATVKNAVECIKLGAIDYLRKPFTPERIREIVTKILNRRELKESDLGDYSSLLEYSKKCINEGNFDVAINCLKKTIDVNVKDGEPFHILGVIYEMKEDYSNAYKYYNIAYQLEPNSESIKENIKRVENKR
jgi:DNA-binding response OmpR family regulator